MFAERIPFYWNIDQKSQKENYQVNIQTYKKLTSEPVKGLLQHQNIQNIYKYQKQTWKLYQ